MLRVTKLDTFQLSLQTESVTMLTISATINPISSHLEVSLSGFNTAAGINNN